MRVRKINDHSYTGWSSSFNPHSLSEIIITYDDGSADSEYFREFEICLENGTWIPFKEALTSHQIISDDRFINFRFPTDDEERDKGYYLY